MEAKRAARMTTIPQLDIPDIFVDDNEAPGRGSIQISPVAEPGSSGAHHLSVHGDQFVSQPSSPDSPVGPSNRDTVLWTGAGNRHPLSFPRSAASSPSPPGTPLGMGFDALDGQHGARTSGGSRPSSNVSPIQASDMLEDSIWLDTIRRSTTIRRPERRSG